MKKKFLLLLLLNTLLSAENYLKELQERGITFQKEGKTITIKREKNPLCTPKMLNPNSLFGESYAGEKVPKVCKKTFVTHVGVLQPMRLTQHLNTVGEVEVLNHILASSKAPDEYILIDARSPQWYRQMTIPTAINLPFDTIKYDEDIYEDDFQSTKEYETYRTNYQRLFRLLNIKKTKKGLDFSHAKIALIFCNGSWCSQSPNAIRYLINLGYPTKKLLWYRGGMQDWLIYDFTVEKF